MMAKQAVLACALSLLLASPTLAGHNTVARINLLRMEPQAGIVTELGTEFTTLTSCGYTEELRIDRTLDIQADVSVTDLRSADLHDRWVLYVAHGGAGYFGVEYYPPDMIGEAARDANLQYYYGLGYTGVYSGFVMNPQGDIEAHTIGVDSTFVRAELDVTGSVFHLAGCQGGSMFDDFSGYRAYLAYPHSPKIGEAKSHITDLYEKLRGWNGGVANRVLSTAVGTLATPRISIWENTGSWSTVLAPAAESWSQPQESSLGTTTNAWIQFQGELDQTLPPSSLLKEYGPIKISNVAWAGSDKITFTMTGKWKGEGAVIVLASKTKSAANHVALDGNTTPMGSRIWNARSPNNDDWVWYLRSTMGGDNPAASITAFTAIDQGHGIQLAWTVEFENQTARYRIDRSSGWSGSYETVADVEATGSHQYTAYDPSGTLNHVYRLIEIETDGRELKQAEEQAVSPFETPGDLVISETVGDSLNQAWLDQYPTSVLQPDRILPIYEWLAVIKDESFRLAIQPLVNYHNSRGRVTSVMTLAELGGEAGIQSFVRSAVPYGLRYETICGDGNNWRDHDDPSSYYGGYLYPGYASQPQHDIIRMSASIPDPVGNQATGLSFFTSRYTTDALYGDVDGDSLADIAVSRIPCRTPAELSAMVGKILAGHNQSPLLDQVGFWGEFRNLSGNDGAFAQQLCDSLATFFPSGTVIRKLYNTESNPIPYATREAQAIAALNEGRSIVMTFGTQSNRAKWSVWLDKTQGFNWAKASNSSTRPYLVAASCDIVDVCRSEDPAYGRPLYEEGLLYPGKAPYAGWGPSRGSWQHDDFAIASLFYEFAFQHGAGSAAEALMLATREYGRRGPEYKHQALEMVHFGDAAALMPGMVVRTTGVDENDRPDRLTFSRPSPNPFSGRVTLQYSLPQPAKVNLAVFDLQGRNVAQLVDGWQQAGIHTTSWEGRGASVYCARLQAGSEVKIQKLVNIR